MPDPNPNGQSANARTPLEEREPVLFEEDVVQLPGLPPCTIPVLRYQFYFSKIVTVQLRFPLLLQTVAGRANGAPVLSPSADADGEDAGATSYRAMVMVMPSAARPDRLWLVENQQLTGDGGDYRIVHEIAPEDIVAISHAIEPPRPEAEKRIITAN